MRLERLAKRRVNGHPIRSCLGPRQEVFSLYPVSIQVLTADCDGTEPVCKLSAFGLLILAEG